MLRPKRELFRKMFLTHGWDHDSLERITTFRILVLGLAPPPNRGQEGVLGRCLSCNPFSPGTCRKRFTLWRVCKGNSSSQA